MGKRGNGDGEGRGKGRKQGREGIGSRKEGWRGNF